MLDNPGPRGLSVCVIDRGVPLEIFPVEHLGFEPDGPVLQVPQTVSEKLIDRAGIHNRCCEAVQFFFVLQIIHPQTHLDAPQHILHHTGIAAHRDPLIERVEVIIVKGVSDRQPADNESRKLIAGTPPLLLRVAPDQFLIDICSDEADRLLLQIFRVRDPRLPALPADFFLRFLRRHDAPHFIEGIHIEGQRIQFAVVIRYGGIGEAVEIRKLSYIIPDAGIAGMKDMGAIPMHMYPFDFFCIDIACHLRPAVDHQHALACLMRPLCKYSAEKSGAHDQIIILFHCSLRFPDLIRLISSLPAESSGTKARARRFRPRQRPLSPMHPASGLCVAALLTNFRQRPSSPTGT